MDSTLEPDEQSNVYNNEAYDGDWDRDEMSGDIIHADVKRKRSNSPFIRATGKHLSDVSSGSFEFPQPPSPDLFVQLQNQKVRRATPPANRVASPFVLSYQNTPTLDASTNRAATPVISSNRSTPTPLSINQMQFRTLNDSFGQPIGLTSIDHSPRRVVKSKKKKTAPKSVRPTNENESTKLDSTLVDQPIVKSTAKASDEPEYAEIKDIIVRSVANSPAQLQAVEQPAKIKTDDDTANNNNNRPNNNNKNNNEIVINSAATTTTPKQTLPYAQVGFSSHALRPNRVPTSLMYESCIEDSNYPQSASAVMRKQQRLAAQRASNECASILDTANIRGGDRTAAAVAEASPNTAQQQIMRKKEQAGRANGTTVIRPKSLMGKESDRDPTSPATRPTLSGTADLGVRSSVISIVSISSDDSPSQNKSAATTSASRVSFSIPASPDRVSCQIILYK